LEQLSVDLFDHMTHWWFNCENSLHSWFIRRWNRFVFSYL